MFMWTFFDSAGRDMGRSERFDDREAAEAWMGEAWGDLRERGVEEVALVEDERDVPLYRMGLGEAPPEA